MTTRYEWNPDKAARNLRKHGVSFENAAQVFDDPLAMATLNGYVDGEERWQMIGRAGKAGMLFVVHLWWEEEFEGEPVEAIRIISARGATASERRSYERQAR